MTTSAASLEHDRPMRRTPSRLRYASFESRVAAGALDLLVLFIIGALLVTAGSLVVLISSDFERVQPSTLSINIFWGAAGSILPAWFLYFFIALTWKGQTVGAAVMQVTVLRSDGRRLGVLGSAARVIGLLAYVVIVGLGAVAAFALRDTPAAAGAAVFIAFLLAALGLIWAAFDSHRRTLHDRIAGTIVVRLE